MKSIKQQIDECTALFQSRKWLLLLMVFVIYVGFCLYFSYEYRFQKNFTLAKFDCGDNYQLVIEVQEELPGNYYLYCTIKKNQKECIPSRLFYFYGSKNDAENIFEMIKTEDGQYIGIVSIYKPETLYIVFHKKTEKLWTLHQNNFEDKEFYSFIKELENTSPDSVN